MVPAHLSGTRKEYLMTDPISQFGRIAQMNTPSGRPVTSKAERPAPAAAGGLAGAAPAQDELKLSDVAQRLMQEPEFDRAKVDAIKQAIQQGQYPLDSRRIAENFTAIEKMIKG